LLSGIIVGRILIWPYLKKRKEFGFIFAPHLSDRLGGEFPNAHPRMYNTSTNIANIVLKLKTLRYVSRIIVEHFLA
jgi:hypothetical protein